MRRGLRPVRGILLLAALSGATAAWPDSPRAASPQRGATYDPTALLAASDSLRAHVRLARIENVPAHLLTWDETYALHLERVADYVASDASRADTSATTWRLVLHLLTARQPAGAAWFAAAAAGHRIVPAAVADAPFWVGVFELGRDRTQSAAAWLAHPAPAHVQAYADWLRVRALDRHDEARGGALALELARRQPAHRFYNELALRAARHLISGKDPRAALALLGELVPRLPGGSQQLARARLWSARAHLDLGDRAAMRAALTEALVDGPVGSEDPNLALRLAREALRDGETSPELRDRCVVVLTAGAPLDEALALWHRHADDLAAPLQATMLDALLKRLNGARREDDIAKLADELSEGAAPALVRRARLEEARFRRRRGQTGAMERAYRAAAGGDAGASRLAAGDPTVGAALWEWGRELEDAERFVEAAAVYERRAAWEQAAGAEPDGALRAGLCAWRAGDPAAALAQLESACAQASPRLLAAPCFWRGILAPARPDTAYLFRAVGEQRPGYAARRSSLAMRPASGGGPGSEGGPAAPGAIWAEVAAAVRDPRDWSWPSCPPALDVESSRRLLALIEEQRAIVEAAVLFETLGRRIWTREFALMLPGVASFSPAEMAAFWRALGHYPAAFAEATDAGHEDYPIAFAHAVAAAARRFGLSPAFIQAVMRQESGLDPAVRSSAGAIGLMQLMPATARRVATSLGMKTYDLERPEDNVMLGAAHLVELLEQSDHNVALCLASYNAGRSNAVRWWRRVEDVPEAYRHDAYLEAIGFAETRTFVRRVLRHYWAIRAVFPPEP